MSIKIQTESGEVEIKEDQLAEAGFLSQDKIKESYVAKDFFQSELQRRLSSATENTKKELMSDDEFFQTLAESKGIKFENGKPKTGSDINIEEIQSKWEAEKLEPVKQKLTQLQQRDKYAEIYKEAVNAGIKEEYLASVVEGDSPMIVKLTEANLKQDEHGNWSLKNGEGFAYASDPSDKRPFAGAKEMFEGLKKNNPSWFKDTQQTGTGFNGSKSTSIKKTRAEMNGREKSRFIAEHGIEKFNELPLK